MARHHVEIETGRVYGTVGDRELRADVYRPVDAPGPLPGVMLIHGGGWRQGDRTQLKGYGILIGREGYVCVAPEYRLVPEAPWPAALDDVRRALTWIRSEAGGLGIDADRVAVEGNSAGAHLALLLAAEGHGVRACIAVYPPVVLQAGAPEVGGTPAAALFDGPVDDAVLEAASPLRRVHRDMPPVQLIHGSADVVVPVAASLRMFEELRRHGVPADLHIYADQPHGFDAEAPLGRIVAAEMVTFLGRYL